MKIKKIIKFIPAVLWMAVIFYFSSRQTTGIGTTATNRFLILKSFHIIEYAFLAFLLSFAIFKKKWVIIIAFLYAISDEIHQSFTPNRLPKIQDTLIDLIGILIGTFILSRIFFFQKKEK